MRTVISGAVSVSNCARSTSSSSAGTDVPFRDSCGTRPQPAPAPRRSARRFVPARRRCGPARNGTFTSCPAFFAASSIAASPPRTIRSASETFFAAGLRGVEFFLDRLQLREHFGQFGGLIDFPIFLRSEPNARAIRAAAFVGAAEGRGRRPCGRDQLGDRETRRENLRLKGGDVLLADQMRDLLRARDPAKSATSFGTSGPR